MSVNMFTSSYINDHLTDRVQYIRLVLCLIWRCGVCIPVHSVNLRFTVLLQGHATYSTDSSAAVKCVSDGQGGSTEH